MQVNLLFKVYDVQRLKFFAVLDMRDFRIESSLFCFKYGIWSHTERAMRNASEKGEHFLMYSECIRMKLSYLVGLKIQPQWDNRSINWSEYSEKQYYMGVGGEAGSILPPVNIFVTSTKEERKPHLEFFCSVWFLFFSFLMFYPNGFWKHDHLKYCWNGPISDMWSFTCEKTRATFVAVSPLSRQVGDPASVALCRTLISCPQSFSALQDNSEFASHCWVYPRVCSSQLLPSFFPRRVKVTP